MIASAVTDFSHNIILCEEVCSVRIIISINNVCVLIVCHDIKKTIIKICKYVAKASSQGNKSIIS